MFSINCSTKSNFYCFPFKTNPHSLIQVLHIRATLYFNLLPIILLNVSKVFSHLWRLVIRDNVFWRRHCDPAQTEAPAVIKQVNEHAYSHRNLDRKMSFDTMGSPYLEFLLFAVALMRR